VPSAYPEGRFRRFGVACEAIARALWNRDVLGDASAMAFALFLASIPMLGLAGVVLARVLRGEPQVIALVSSLIDVAPEDVRAIVDRHLARGADETIAPLFLLSSLWMAAGAFHAAMTAYEHALDANRRSFIEKRAIALGCVVALIAALVVLSALTVALSGGPLAIVFALFDRVGFADGGARSPGAFPPLLAAGVAFLFVGAFFRIGVRHRHSRPAIWPGAAATSAIGTLSSVAFGKYAQSLARYAVFYGSLAAVAVFLLWLWLCCVALLVGVEVNAHVESNRAKRASDRRM
jgi:membrane protein